jgi:1,4-alpha-glucan branching enzyme
MRVSRAVKEKAPKITETVVSTIGGVKSAGTGVAEFYGVHQIVDGVMFVAFYPQANTVQVAGDFNNWQPGKNPMQNIGDGNWQVRIPLARGTYRYRLVVDGHWQQDPHNPMTELNPYNELNSVVKVK